MCVLQEQRNKFKGNLQQTNSIAEKFFPHPSVSEKRPLPIAFSIYKENQYHTTGVPNRNSCCSLMFYFYIHCLTKNLYGFNHCHKFGSCLIVVLLVKGIKTVEYEDCCSRFCFTQSLSSRIVWWYQTFLVYQAKMSSED